MNREIKFRAWDKKGRQMINYISSLNFRNQNFINIVSEYDLDVHNGENLGHYERHVSEVEVMQYTGLKDKNGKEIYEGDIIENNDYKWKITWEEGCVYLKGIGDTKGKWWIGTENGYSEIIGNIYENPELINPNE